MIVFSQYLRNVGIPWLVYTNGKCCLSRIYVFQLFPVLMSIVAMWIICAILTSTDYLDKDDKGRTDLKINLLYNSKWFRFPYPCNYREDHKVIALGANTKTFLIIAEI
jgi:nucleobase transporter 1/2